MSTKKQKTWEPETVQTYFDGRRRYSIPVKTSNPKRMARAGKRR